MFKKLFSCLGDTSQSEQVADLSMPGQPIRNPQGNGMRPELHPESNING